MRNSVAEKTGLPGFGVSLAGLSSSAAADAGSGTLRRATIARASASVDGSGTVGPEAITAGSSKGTSEIASVSTGAGAATAASRPPLMRDRCFRTVLISPMVAPERNSARVMPCFSSSVSWPAGAIQFAEPPPDSSTRTRSSAVASPASASVRSVASTPWRSGIGWPASTTGISPAGSP